MKYIYVEIVKHSIALYVGKSETTLSAIFMPITLLAGIWGMNFEKMPELGFPLGYPMALGLMMFIGLWMLWLFRKGGWFD